MDVIEEAVVAVAGELALVERVRAGAGVVDRVVAVTADGLDDELAAILAL